MSQSVYSSVKMATVAVAIMHPARPGPQNKPFTILGSGFCIHPDGIVVTCEHVLRAAMEPESYKRFRQSIDANPETGQLHELKGATPHVIFYHPHPVGDELHAFPVPVQNAITKTNFDLAALKIPKHVAFQQGYPILPIAKFKDVYEMMEIATCGFPLGDFLEQQIGTATSSFTKGMISSIIPLAGVAQKDVRGFQLDLTATNGNSGGPVFSLATGEVFGVLQQGIAHHPTGRIVQGITKAEPIYPIFEHDLVNRLLKGLTLPTGSVPKPA